MPDVGKIIKTRDGFEWRIISFLNLSEEDDYWSPLFHYNGVRWWFLIFPNGEYNNGYVELELVKCYSDPISIKISFALKTVNGEKHMEKQYAEHFVKWNDNRKYTEFIARAELVRKKAELLPSGVLTIVFTPQIPASASEDEVATANCSFCKKSFDAQKLPSHEKKCRIKCPECSDVILLQNWDEHECQISRAEGGDNAPESSAVHHRDKILQDFKELFLKQENCDVVLRVKEREFPAHRAILTARSPVFASIFCNDMKEKETGVVDIEDCYPSIFPDFLCFLYCGDMNTLSSESVFNHFTAADKYDVSDLKSKCIEFMKENLSIETFCKTMSLALLHTETELIRYATDFFVENAEQILETLRWQSFVHENPAQSNELFIKYVKSTKH